MFKDMLMSEQVINCMYVRSQGPRKQARRRVTMLTNLRAAHDVQAQVKSVRDGGGTGGGVPTDAQTRGTEHTRYGCKVVPEAPGPKRGVRR